LNLTGARAGASVIVLGAGLAGMLAAYELTKAGYKVKILEYQNRAGGRNWSLYGGDTYTELGGATQKVTFAPGNYLNPGPWRIPHHHRTLLHYCKAFGVALEPFIQFNHNAYVTILEAFGGKPQRFKAAGGRLRGQCRRAARQGDRPEVARRAAHRRGSRPAEGGPARLGHARRRHGNTPRACASSGHRGYDAPGGGVNGAPIPSEPSSWTTCSTRASGPTWASS
jgi:monoamine oxidase